MATPHAITVMHCESGSALIPMLRGANGRRIQASWVDANSIGVSAALLLCWRRRSTTQLMHWVRSWGELMVNRRLSKNCLAILGPPKALGASARQGAMPPSLVSIQWATAATMPPRGVGRRVSGRAGLRHSHAFRCSASAAGRGQCRFAVGRLLLGAWRLARPAQSRRCSRRAPSVWPAPRARGHLKGGRASQGRAGVSRGAVAGAPPVGRPQPRSSRSRSACRSALFRPAGPSR